jgi:hypothetical protein
VASLHLLEDRRRKREEEGAVPWRITKFAFVISNETFPEE